MSRGVCIQLTVYFLVPAVAHAEIPFGFEIIPITDDFDLYDDGPGINDCGQVVFATWLGASAEDAEVFLYDNGHLVQLSDNIDPDVFPAINNLGDIIWGRGIGSVGVHQLILYQDGRETLLTDHSEGIFGAKDINDLGHVVWSEKLSTGCGFGDNRIMFYDGENISTVIPNGGSHQTPRLNKFDEIVWTKYNFCVNPWESEIMMAADGAIVQVSTGQFEVQNSGINDSSEVVWAGPDGLQLWHPPGVIPELSDDGYYGTVTDILTNVVNNASLNNRGDICYQQYDEELGKTQIWLYSGGQFHQITNDPVVNQFTSKINDWGEIVWKHSAFPQGDIMFMRRIRNGEANFDGFVDRRDLAVLVPCLTGPVVTDRLCDCRFLDIDHDRDVDLGDFALYQNNYGWQAPPDLKHPPGVGEVP